MATRSAGHAVAFIEAPMPSARPASTGLRCPEVGEPEAEERDHRHVGPADGELEGDHRGRRDQDRPAAGITRAALAQGEPEHDEEHRRRTRPADR